MTLCSHNICPVNYIKQKGQSLCPTYCSQKGPTMSKFNPCTCLLHIIVFLLTPLSGEDILWASDLFTKVFTYLDFPALIKGVSRLKHKIIIKKNETVTFVAMKSSPPCINPCVYVCKCVRVRLGIENIWMN